MSSQQAVLVGQTRPGNHRTSMRLDRYLKHAIPLIGEHVVRVFDFIQHKSVRHQWSQVGSLRL
jgi:hypothetical protein